MNTNKDFGDFITGMYDYGKVIKTRVDAKTAEKLRNIQEGDELCLFARSESSRQAGVEKNGKPLESQPTHNLNVTPSERVQAFRAKSPAPQSRRTVL